MSMANLMTASVLHVEDVHKGAAALNIHDAVAQNIRRQSQATAAKASKWSKKSAAAAGSPAAAKAKGKSPSKAKGGGDSPSKSLKKALKPGGKK